jgi:hypothetical protein
MKKPLGLFSVLLLLATPSFAANPSMSEDFNHIMEWLSLEMAHGLAFNAGSTFDPAEEVKGIRLQPDASLGIGSMPLDKSKFPEPGTPALKELGIKNIFPNKVLFPNLTMHFRAGLPGRSDFAIRFTDMTTPPNYQISPGTTGKGQSNSLGFAVRKHFLGGALPTLSIGANFNHVFGKFQFNTKFNVTNAVITADNDVTGTIQWSVNSFGLNAVASKNYKAWTPFGGVGLNYATGSVRSRLEVISNTPLIAPIIGEASRHPESTSARVILGTQYDRSWMQMFVNTEVKAIGVHKGESWIMHAGMLLPFRIGTGGSASRQASVAKPLPPPAVRLERVKPAPYVPKQKPDVENESASSLIFLQ